MLTWGRRILTLCLNYVACYTGPLLFLFERTHNYYVDNQGLVPWRLRHLGCLLCFIVVHSAGIAPGSEGFTVKYHVIFGISRDILRGILCDVEINRTFVPGFEKSSAVHLQNAVLCVCVLFCFIKLILGNRYGVIP